MVRRAFTLLVLLTTPLAAAAEFQGRARLWVGPAFDSNARRDFVSPELATAPDLFLFGLGQLEGTLRLGERVRLVGSYDLGARKFLLIPSEDTVVQSAQLEAQVTFGKYFAFGVDGRLRDRRGAGRDYTDLQGGALLDFFPDPSVDMRVQVNAHRFLFYGDAPRGGPDPSHRFAYSFWGPDGTVNARYRFNRRHSVSVFGSYNPRTYNGIARFKPGPEGSPPPPEEERADKVFGGGLSYSYRGPFHFTFSYSYFDQDSNSYGERVQRHRLNATFGARLPWELTFLSSLTWQPSVFPEGVYLSPDLTVLEEDENVSSLTLKLMRPLNKWLDLDVRYAGYLGFLPQNNFLYVRHVFSVGLAVNF